MILVDVHAHLDMKQFSQDLPEVLERAKSAGMVAVISQGVHQESNEATLALAEKYPLIQAALGLYPLNAPNVTLNEESDDYDRSSVAVDSTLKFIKKNADKIIAIGEVGIDLQYSDDLQHQRENFIKVLRLATEIKKPVIIHSRKAEKEILDILEQSKFSNVILHCFGGSKKLIKRAVEAGYHLTVTSIANRLQHFQMMAKIVPLTQLFTETDAPYLSPVKDERNEPKNVDVAIEVIAKAKGLTPEEVSKSLYMNYQRVFL